MRWKKLGHVDRIVIIAVTLAVCIKCLEKCRKTLLRLFSTAQVRPTQRKACKWERPLPQFQRPATFQGSSGQALKAELASVTLTALGHWLWLQFDFSGQRAVHDPRLGAPTPWSRFLWPFPILRQEGGCSGHSGHQGGLEKADDLPVLPEWQSWGAASGLTSAQPGALFPSANWQLPRTKSSLSRASVDSWSVSAGHSSVCTWSFPTFKEENLPHEVSLLEPLSTSLLPALGITPDESSLAARSAWP